MKYKYEEFQDLALRTFLVKYQFWHQLMINGNDRS